MQLNQTQPTDFQYREALNYAIGYLSSCVRTGMTITGQVLDRLINKVEKEYGITLTKEVLNGN